MNHAMAYGAEQRLDAQIAEALFGQPGMSKMDVANRVRELRGDGPALLVGGSHGSEVQVADGPWPEIDAILADAYSAGAVGLPFGGIARRAAVRAALAAKAAHQPEYLHGSDELRARVEGERAAYLEGLEEGKLIAAQPSPGGQGNALASLPLYRLADDANGNRGLHRDETGSWVKLQDVERALAARQPVDEVSVKKEDANNYCLILRALGMEEEGDPVAEVKALIEARDRQPVGEPVAVVTTSERFTYGKLNRALPDGTPLYAAQPAQAVDLGELREMLVGWKNSDYPLSYEGQCAQRALDACIADLQALIDGKAVGND